ncbi:hypothetical protein ES703_109721 [subsurface metagenome]
MDRRFQALLLIACVVLVMVAVVTLVSAFPNGKEHHHDGDQPEVSLLTRVRVERGWLFPLGDAYITNMWTQKYGVAEVGRVQPVLFEWEGYVELWIKSKAGESFAGSVKLDIGLGGGVTAQFPWTTRDRGAHLLTAYLYNKGGALTDTEIEEVWV